MTTSHNFQTLGRAVIDTELNAITRLIDNLDENFDAACEIMLACKGRVVVLGMGKSGHIAGKVAATLASTGTPAFFVHPGEANHGDLGMITAQDVVYVISYSGKTPEILSLLPLIKRLQVPMIAITGNPHSDIAKFATVHLDASVEKEACPHNLAPTASTTSALVLGDALAIALLSAKGFSKEDFARSHPGGNLGRRLLLHVSDVMRTDKEVPMVPANTAMTAAVLEVSSKKLGFTTVVDKDNSLLGIFTDGDLRRALDNDIDIKHTSVNDVMSRGGITVNKSMLAVEASILMEKNKITGLVVTDENSKVVGALNIHDLFSAGVL